MRARTASICTSGYTDTQGLHGHLGSTDTQGNHVHQSLVPAGVGVAAGPFNSLSGSTQQYVGTDAQGAHAHNIATDAQGNHVHNVNTYPGQGGHYHYPSLGGGGQVLVVIPMFLACTKMIYCGPPNTPLRIAPSSRRLLAAPRRGGG